MIYLAFGSNLKSRFGNSLTTIQKSYCELEKHGVEIIKNHHFTKVKHIQTPRIQNL